jgi:hypothetical protein
VANYDLLMTLGLTDANGDRAQMRVNLGTVGDTLTLAVAVANVTAALAALGAPGVITNAKVTSAGLFVLVEKANPTGALDAQFSSVQDAAKISLLNSLAGKGSSSIPAPVPGVFGASPNQETVDPGGAAAPWIAYLVSHAATPGSASLLNVYNGGVKVGKHATRRAQHRVV